MDEQTTELLRRLERVERPRGSALDHALCDASNLILAQDAALSAGQADARRLSEAPLVTVKADAIGNHIDLPSWHAADPQPGTYRLVPERGEVSDG